MEVVVKCRIGKSKMKKVMCVTWDQLDESETENDFDED